MFLCFPIIFIISISETRSERSLSVASSGESKGGKEKNVRKKVSVLGYSYNCCVAMWGFDGETILRIWRYLALFYFGKKNQNKNKTYYHGIKKRRTNKLR